MRTHFKTGLVLVVFGALAACGRPEPQSPHDPISGNNPKPQQAINDPKPQQSNMPVEHGPQQSTFGSGGPQQSAMGTPESQKPLTEPTPQKPIFGEDRDDKQAKQEKPLNDGEIMGVIVTTNTGEIDMANLAKKNATSKDVKDFAAMMLSQHTDAQNKAKNVQGKAKVQTEPNDVSSHVKSEAETAMTNLRDKKGAEFDRLYIDTQVRAHQDVLDTIDNKLLPNAKSADVKSYVSEVRQHVAMHLSKAKDIQKKIDPTTAAAHEKGMSVVDDQKAKTPAKKDTTTGKDKDKGKGDKGAGGNRD